MNRFASSGACLLALTLVACGTTLRGRVSAPLDDESWSKRDYTWESKQPELVLSVGAANFHLDGKPHESFYLTVWVRIKPLAEGVGFAPHRFRLSSEEVEELPPDSARGPFPISLETGLRLPRSLECFGAGVHTLDGWSLGGSRIVEGQVVPVVKKACFGVNFKVHDTPSHPFTLTVDGIEVAGVPVPPTEVRFREATYEIYIDGYHGTPDYIFVRPAD